MSQSKECKTLITLIKSEYKKELTSDATIEHDFNLLRSKFKRYKTLYRDETSEIKVVSRKMASLNHKLLKI